MATPAKKIWKVSSPIPAETAARLDGYSPILKQLMYNRGISDPEEADLYLNRQGSLYDPFLLPDMEVAVERIFRAISNQEAMAVYGDYDVDGVTATTLLVEVLRRYGGNAIGYIPNRFDEGYGINNEALDQLYEQGVRLVISADCGIRSPREALHARKIGLDLIISDHHEPKDDLPQALAVICQKRADNRYPDRNLAGVGLVFKIAEALNKKQPESGVKADEWLDLVALGTVADVVPLTGENRGLVRGGLQVLRRGQRLSLVSLANVAKINVPRLSGRDIGFGLGPRLNAAGRLETARAALDLLLSQDMREIGVLTQNLDDSNRERQALTQTLQTRAMEQMSEDELQEFLLFSILPDQEGEQRIMGLVGLVASRLTDAHYRPAVVGAKGPEFTRASCRSIPEFNITKALDECSELMERHGGHAMAAGFTIRNERLPELAERLKSIARRELAERELLPVVRIDLEITLKEMKASVWEDLQRLEPTGQSNSDAMFLSRGLRVVNYRKIGSDGKHLKLTVQGDRITFDAVAFRQGDWANHMPEKIDLVYAFEKDNYGGYEKFQLNVRDLRPAETN